MAKRKMPWFRVYTEMIDDEKLRILAFEDRWHFVAILCCKRAGMLDAGDTPKLLCKKMAIKLGLHGNELELVASRLSEVGLIDEKTFQPVAWNIRQFDSDSDPTATNRKRKQRAKLSKVTDMSRVTGTDVTRTDTDTDTDTKEKHDAPASSFFDGMDQSVVRDFKKLRRSLKAPITQTVMKGIEREADKAGMTLEQALRTCCEKSWRSFNASWLDDSSRGSVSGRRVDANGKPRVAL